MKEKVQRVMAKRKSIALVAHDNMKETLMQWCLSRKQLLANHRLLATGTTGALLQKT